MSKAPVEFPCLDTQVYGWLNGFDSLRFSLFISNHDGGRRDQGETGEHERERVCG